VERVDLFQGEYVGTPEHLTVLAIAAHADCLFLLVPQELRQNPTMSPRREFATAQRRLRTFFEPGNYTNVRGLCLFGD